MAKEKDAILGVEDLLGRFRADGQAESSGSFTLDPKKALERLAQFQLPGFYHWILKVVQSLHMSGARQIRIDAGVNKVHLVSDVVPRGFDCVDDLLSHLLAETADANPALRHLAAGLQGSLAVKPSVIGMTTILEGEKREFVLKAGGWRDGERAPAPSGQERFEFRLIRNLSEKLNHSWFLLNVDIFDLMFGRRGALDREEKVVFEHCDWCQTDVLLGNRSVNQCRFGSPRFKGYEVRHDPNPGKSRPATLKTWLSETDLVDNVAHPRHHLAEIVIPSDEPGGFRLESQSHATWTNRTGAEVAQTEAQNGLTRAYAIRMDLANKASIWFWEDGVLLGRRTIPSPVPGLVALVDARELGKDLTTLQVLEDDRLRALFDDVLQHGEILKQKIRENINLMPPSQRIQSRLGI